MSDLQWRKEPPDKPGCYWMRRGVLRPKVVDVIRIDGKGKPRVFEAGNEDPLLEAEMHEAQWAGPIDHPRDA